MTNAVEALLVTITVGYTVVAIAVGTVWWLVWTGVRELPEFGGYRNASSVGPPLRRKLLMVAAVVGWLPVMLAYGIVSLSRRS